MKSLITVVVCFLLSFTATASHSEVLTSELLTHQTWIGTSQSNLQVYYDFQEPAILDIIENKDGKISWTTAFWKLVHMDGQDFLLIRKNESGNDERFLIVLELTDLTLSNSDSEIVLKRLGRTDFPGNISKSDLQGRWKSPFYNKRNGKVANGKTPLRNMWKTVFEFKKDGTFQRHIQIGTYVEAETGVWNLSNDGQFIKLHFSLDGNSENIYKKEVLNIDNYTGQRMKLRTDAAHDKFMEEFELVKKS